jgi:polyferredoxin
MSNPSIPFVPMRFDLHRWMIMRIVWVRRISQGFFLALFVWFCVVSSLGVEVWQLRGWPVSWFLHLDPLVALGTLLTTRALYADLLWALVTVILTIMVGRFFCGWVCPFGTLHHAVGYWGKRSKSMSERIAGNRFSRHQSVKVALLVFLLSAGAGSLVAHAVKSVFRVSPALWGGIAVSVFVAGAALTDLWGSRKRAGGVVLALVGFWTAVGSLISVERMIGASLQTGLLDPIPLLYRSVNLVLLPLADASSHLLSVDQRHYEGAWFIGLLFGAALLLNLKVPRFYCRFVCPLGALFGVLARYAVWRIGKTCSDCVKCGRCEADCEGACEPLGQIRIPECVLCMNCYDGCTHGVMSYNIQPSASGEIVSPNLSRRGAVLALATGMAVIPVTRLGGQLGANWNSGVIRPPGALPEEEFLKRCIKCGQCMRVCPTNIIHPAGFEAGPEAVWTPVLNYRIGTSGCQLNCIACAHICPTAAIRPISLDEKKGMSSFNERGPIRMGMAFVDHGRCLPWAMDRPCIVCQENCPVSPKAIFVREHFSPIRGGLVSVQSVQKGEIELAEGRFRGGELATGDYFLEYDDSGEAKRAMILENNERTVTVQGQFDPDRSPLKHGRKMVIQVRLQRPQVDPVRCIGCGICEHECPVSGRRAIRITAENESRSRRRSLLL